MVNTCRDSRIVAALVMALLGLPGGTCLSATPLPDVQPHGSVDLQTPGTETLPRAQPDSTASSASDLYFRDFYKMPVGPRGLEPTDKLLGLNGKPVRIRGYMVHQQVPMSGVFILSPLPVELGAEDESLADDLPPAVVFVHLDASFQATVPYVPAVIQLTGVLSLGPEDEPEGRVSHVRLQLDPAHSAAVMNFASHAQVRE